MITLFVALYSLLCLCTTAQISDIKDLQVKTVNLREDVIMKCNISGVTNTNNLVWYRQSFGKMPQVLAKSYKNTLGYDLVEGFNDNHFSVTVNENKFDLNINETREDDGGEYFCGYVEGNIIKFTSGTRLQFEGEEMKPCPTPGTLNSSNGEGPGDINWIIALIASNIISVIVIMVLVGVLFKHQRKGSSSSNHQTSTNQADDEDVLNYAAVSFAKKPSSSRTSRDTKNHQDVYAQVKM